MSEERHVAQNNPDLLATKITNGNCCAHTCMLNLMRALYRYKGRYDLDMDYDGKTVAKMKELFSLSSRIGMTSDGGLTGPAEIFMFRELFRKGPLKTPTFNYFADEHLRENEKDPFKVTNFLPQIQRAHLVLQSNELGLIGVAQNSSLVGGHAMILLRYNSSTDEAFVSDPNLPNTISVLKFDRNYPGLRFNYAGSGTYEIFSILKLSAN